MNIEKRVALVRKVHESTMKGTVDWEKTAHDSAFQATVGGFIVRIVEYSVPDEFEMEYDLEIKNSEGESVDRISYRDFPRANRPEGFEPWPLMKETYVEARRKAMGADKAIEEILKSLT